MVRAVAVALVLSATACGGGSSTPNASGPSPSPSITVPGLISSAGAVPADYLTQVDATCAASLAQLRERGPVPLGPTDARHLTAKQLRGAAAFLQRGADIQKAAAAAVGSFAPPPVGADQWAVYRTAVARFAAGMQDEATAAKAGAVARFLAAAQRLLGLHTRALDSGLVVGLGAGTACARLF